MMEYLFSKVKSIFPTLDELMEVIDPPYTGEALAPLSSPNVRTLHERCGTAKTQNLLRDGHSYS
jgi:hypothetical protein